MKRGLIFWLTGLSGAGKTTLVEKVRVRLNGQNVKTVILDGDDVRRRLHRHLGFSEAEIKENNALVAGLCEEERKRTEVVLVSIISPYAESRARVREQLSPGFFEIHVHAEFQVLEKRDTKGLYAMARNGEMDNLIGYSAGYAYEPPVSPDLLLDTSATAERESVETFLNFIQSRIREDEN